MVKYLALLVLGFFAIPNISIAQFNDSTHYSEVFKKDKSYRIFFPDSYAISPSEHFPVVYFFHGWGGSHDQDPSAKISHDSVRVMVAKSNAILVMWNGRSENDNPRPYNIGDHEHVKYKAQFKDYFLEFVEHIDNTYRTKTNRENRATIGFSMGGFMSFYLAGKYPEMINTAVDVVGSAEFNVGSPDNFTLYSHRFTMGNLHGVKLRFHNSSEGELTYLNSEVNNGAIREKGLDYLYKKYPGHHQFNKENTNTVLQETYDWVLASFNKPTPKPNRWNHVDLYSEFNVWGYKVKSNKNEPGFIELKGVTKGGMRLGTKRWLPYGPIISNIETEVTTAPIYKTKSRYTIIDFNQTKNTISKKRVKSDKEGSVSFSTDGEVHNVGIITKNSPADIVFVNYKVNSSKKFLEQGKEGLVSIKLFNRGGSTVNNLKIEISTEQEGVSITNPIVSIPTLKSGDTITVDSSFKIKTTYSAHNDASPLGIRFNLEFTEGNSNKWFDEFDIPVFFDLPTFTDIKVDDGVKVKDEVYGKGNANGIVEAGENVMLYFNNSRLRLYYDDPYVEVTEERLYDETLFAHWEADGVTLSSIIKISDDCPEGHVINFMASWEYKEYNPINRHVYWGEFSITVGTKGSASKE